MRRPLGDHSFVANHARLSLPRPDQSAVHHRLLRPKHGQHDRDARAVPRALHRLLERSRVARSASRHDLADDLDGHNVLQAVVPLLRRRGLERWHLPAAVRGQSQRRRLLVLFFRIITGYDNASCCVADGYDVASCRVADGYDVASCRVADGYDVASCRVADGAWRSFESDNRSPIWIWIWIWQGCRRRQEWLPTPAPTPTPARVGRQERLWRRSWKSPLQGRRLWRFGNCDSASSRKCWQWLYRQERLWIWQGCRRRQEWLEQPERLWIWQGRRRRQERL